MVPFDQIARDLIPIIFQNHRVGKRERSDRKVSAPNIAKCLKGQISQEGILTVDPHPDGSRSITAYTTHATLLEILYVNRM